MPDQKIGPAFLFSYTGVFVKTKISVRMIKRLCFNPLRNIRSNKSTLFYLLT